MWRGRKRICAKAHTLALVVNNNYSATASTVHGNQVPVAEKPKVLTGIDMVGEFVGRESGLEKLDKLLEGPNHFITIHGFGGLGKTALALQVAQRFDGGKVLGISLIGTPKLSDVIR